MSARLTFYLSFFLSLYDDEGKLQFKAKVTVAILSNQVNHRGSNHNNSFYCIQINIQSSIYLLTNIKCILPKYFKFLKDYQYLLYTHFKLLPVI